MLLRSPIAIVLCVDAMFDDTITSLTVISDRRHARSVSLFSPGRGTHTRIRVYDHAFIITYDVVDSLLIYSQMRGWRNFREANAAVRVCELCAIHDVKGMFGSP